MIKIKKEKSYDMTCGNCKSKLEFEESDVHYGEYGNGFIKCPNCNHQNKAHGFEIDITPENFEYNEHCRFVKSHSVMFPHIIQEKIKGLINHLIEADYEWASTSLDDTVIICLKNNNRDFQIYIAEKYAHTIITKEDGVNEC